MAKKSKKRAAAEAAEKELVAKKVAEREAKKLADEEAAAEAAEQARLAEEERVRLENEAKLQQDRAEKEALVQKLQAVHRGRAARRAAKEEAMARHDVCEVRVKVHQKSMENPLADDSLSIFDAEEKTVRTDLSSADDHVVEGRALYCLSQESGLRHTFNEFLNDPKTSAFLLGCIILNVFILAIETPTSTLSQETRDYLHYADLCLSIIFSSKQGQCCPSKLPAVAALFADPRCCRFLQSRW
eukprot:COSAG02_NODE_801_length_17030_cov_150.308428_2_plen_243_part_00